MARGRPGRDDELAVDDLADDVLGQGEQVVIGGWPRAGPRLAYGPQDNPALPGPTSIETFGGSKQDCRYYNVGMVSTRTADYLEAVDHLPEGTTLVIHDLSWDDYERLLVDRPERPHLRISYDRGKLEVMSPLPEHEAYARFIDRVVGVCAELLDLKLESYGSATWKRRALGRGVEPDACYYVASADRIIGKGPIDLESDPPPDVVVEIDVTNESLGKFAIYAALSVREIWRYDGKQVQFYKLTGDQYSGLVESPSFPGLTPAMLAGALEQSKAEGQTAALRAFRQRWPASRTPDS